MSSNYNPEYYLDIIEKKSSSYIKELSDIKSLLWKIDTDYEKLFFMQISIPKIYAIYEGFFKFIFKFTIIYISQLSISNSKLHENFMIFSLLTHLNPNIQNQNKRGKKILEIINCNRNESISILEKFNYSSYTLNLDTTKATLEFLDIDIPDIRFNNLDKLYQIRNDIAHGDIDEDNPFYLGSDLDLSDSYILVETTQIWERTYETVLHSINVLSDNFSDYIINEKYIKTY